MDAGKLEGIPLPFERAMTMLERWIMDEIVRAIRINGFSTATAEWQMNRLIQLGKSEASIKKYVQRVLDLTDEELERVYSETVYREYYGYGKTYRHMGVSQIPFEKNLELQALIKAVKEQTKNEFKNITRSMGFAIKNPATGKTEYSPLMDFYRNTLDDAVMGIVSGGFTYDKVLAEAVDHMTTSGVRWIDYSFGRRNRVDVAIRRAVMTGYRQVQEKMNEQVARDLGTDSYEVSYHVGARPEHQVWQGKVYTYEELQTVCGLGSVTGLHGANCYHDYTAFVPGASVRTYTDEELKRRAEKENAPKRYNGKSYTAYEALQEQRRKERIMRKTREEIRLLKEGEADKDLVATKQARYRLQQQQYKIFSEKMGLPEQMKRVYGDGIKKI